MSMPLDQALGLLEKSLDGFGRLSDWEKEFIAGIVRIGASGKMFDLSDAQSKSLVGIYCKLVLMNRLPVEYRTLAGEQARKADASAIKEDSFYVIRLSDPPNQPLYWSHLGWVKVAAGGDMLKGKAAAKKAESIRKRFPADVSLVEVTRDADGNVEVAARG